MSNKLTVIKLNTIDSTNSFLKQQTKQTFVANFTLVHAVEQTAGRGQMGATWLSEAGKSLTFSLLVRKPVEKFEHDFEFQMLVSVAIHQSLNKFGLASEIKWPNDIMADGRKLGGILIEQLNDSQGNPTFIVGIGINVKQSNFNELPSATSLLLNGVDIEDDTILMLEIRDQIIALLDNRTAESLAIIRTKYLSVLMKYQKPAVYQVNNHLFNALILGVSPEGKLVLQHENDEIREYSIKEVKMMY